VKTDTTLIVNVTLTRIEWARLPGQRPRAAGCNARLGAHGQDTQTAIARVTTDDGLTGFGWAWLTREQAQDLVDAGPCTFNTLPSEEPFQVPEHFRALEYPLLDLVGKRMGNPIYALGDSGNDIDATLRQGEGYRVPCYDTSLYMDDISIEDNAEAAALIATEAMEGFDRGHRAFKIKIGRGAMHLPLEQGTQRDILIIHAVREAVGPEARIFVDANNGYNLNLTKRVLRETADAEITWIEEPFHEDARLYANLKTWLTDEGLETLIADGEGEASPHLLTWAQQGLIDVIQYDVLHPGFSHWLALGPQLDAWDVYAAPHHYGEAFGNYSACHLASRIQKFMAVEWDEIRTPGLDPSGYTISEGYVNVPDRPGFGLRLDEKRYQRAVRQNGFDVHKM
jgi:L-alanine-DL-glutamate epimerase-like enolase superfamily enzyme